MRKFMFFQSNSVKHYIVVVLLWGVAWDCFTNLLPHTIIKWDVFICCNLFSSNLLDAFLFFMNGIHSPHAVNDLAGQRLSFSLLRLTWIAALSEAKPEPEYSYSE